MTDNSITLYEQEEGNSVYLVPATNTSGAIARYNAVGDFVKYVLKDGFDYGTIPGTGAKPTLLKPGAEKLCALFGLAITYELVDKEMDWTGANHGGEPFFYFNYRVRLMKNDRVMGEGEGSCNSWESKYRYRWANEDEVPSWLDKAHLPRRSGGKSEFAFAVDKAETGGQYGKPAAYWQEFKDAIANGTAKKITRATKTGKIMDAWEIGATQYRIPNTDIADQVNTLQKMSQKRGLIAATLNTVNASDYFTQDIEDGGIIEGEFRPAPAAPRVSAPEPEFDDDLPPFVNAPQAQAPAKKSATERPLDPSSLYEMIQRKSKSLNASTTGQDVEIRKALQHYLGGDEDMRHAIQMYLLDVPSLNAKDQPADGKVKAAIYTWLKPVDAADQETGEKYIDIDKWAKQEIGLILDYLASDENTSTTLPFA